MKISSFHTQISARFFPFHFFSNHEVWGLQRLEGLFKHSVIFSSANVKRKHVHIYLQIMITGELKKTFASQLIILNENTNTYRDLIALIKDV